MITIGVDVDAVLRNWSKSFNNVYRKVFPQHANLLKDDKEWVNLESLNYENLGLEKFLEKHSLEIYLTAEALPNVLTTMNWLKQMCKDLNFNLVIISKQTLEVEKTSTYTWLKANGLALRTNIFINTFEEKWKYADIIIDDSIAVLKAKPENKVSIKVSMPYNKEIDSDITIKSFGNLIPQDILNAVHILEKK